MPTKFLCLCLLLASSNLYAALGMPVNTARYALSVGPTHIEVNDPQGDNRGSANSVALGYSDWLYRDLRYWVEWQQLSMDVQPSPTEVGQFVQHQALSLSSQKQLPLHPHFRPWLNLGLVIAHSRYSLRHTITEDGFLLQRYDDRSSNSVGLLIGTQATWELRREWALGFKAQQSMVPGNNLNYRSATLLLVYQP